VLKLIDVQEANVINNFKIGALFSEDDTLARKHVAYKHLMFVYN